MATRIEINIDEYNALREQINGLKGQVFHLTEENKHLKEQVQNFQDKLTDVRNLKFFERVFHWKSSFD